LGHPSAINKVNERGLAGRTGLGLDSRLTVARLGLATASPFCLLAEYGSGVLAPAEAKQLASFRQQKTPSDELMVFLLGPSLTAQQC
jgi:hypothetical protein